MTRTAITTHHSDGGGSELLTDQIRVVVADDHPIALRGMRALLQAEDDIDVIDTATDADAAAWSIARHLPDVAVLDLNMPGRPVMQLLPELREQFPATRIVIMTMAQGPAYARRALGSGASAYVLKDGADEDLITAVRAVAEPGFGSGSFLNPRLAHQIAAEESLSRPGGLSVRQLEIVRLLSLGYTNVQISERMFLSVRTIESHRAQIMTRLGFGERHELVAFALSHGLIGPRA